MPKTKRKSGDNAKIQTFDTNRFRNSIKVINPNDPDYLKSIDFCNPFIGNKGSQTNSRSSESSCGQPKPTKKTKSCNESKHSPNKNKSSAKHKSRFMSQLTFERVDTNEDLISENYEIDSIDEMPSISDVSSPLKSSLPIIDSNSSPISSKRRGHLTERKESKFHHLIQKSFFNFFDESITKFEKSINKSRIKNVDISLRSRALNVFKNMRKSRVEFCHRNSIHEKDNYKPLVLKMTANDTQFGITFLRSVVLSDPNEEFEANTSVVLVIKHQIIDNLNSSSKYRINVFRRWNQLTIESQIYIFNAFNVEFIENNETIDEEEESHETDYAIIWQTERP